MTVLDPQRSLFGTRFRRRLSSIGPAQWVMGVRRLVARDATREVARGATREPAAHALAPVRRGLSLARLSQPEALVRGFAQLVGGWAPRALRGVAGAPGSPLLAAVATRLVGGVLRAESALLGRESARLEPLAGALRTRLRSVAGLGALRTARGGLLPASNGSTRAPATDPGAPAPATGPTPVLRLEPAATPRAAGRDMTAPRRDTETRMRDFGGLSGLPFDVRALFEASATPLLVLIPRHFTVVAANEAYLRLTLATRDELLDRPLFDVFSVHTGEPAAVAARQLRASLERVLAHRRSDVLVVSQHEVCRAPQRSALVEPRPWTSINTPVLDDRGEVACIVHLLEDTSEAGPAQASASRAAPEARARADSDVIAQLHDARQALERAVRVRSRTDQRLRVSEARLQVAADLLGLAHYSWDPRENTLAWDTRTRALWGLPPDADVSYDIFMAGIHPEDRHRVVEAFMRSTDPSGDGVCDIEYRVIGLRDGAERWIATRGQAVFERGVPVAFNGVALDITQRKRTEHANLLLIAELEHRTRNLLAVVNALAEQTLRSADLSQFVPKLRQRLSALSRVQGVLSRGQARPVMLAELVELELRALGAAPDGQRVRLEGPDVVLPNRFVQIMTMALHELATNARDYGALGSPGGTLSVSWQVRPAGFRRALQLVWLERGLPPRSSETAPRSGFGRMLIEKSLAFELDAKTHLEIGANHVRCSVSMLLGADPERGGA